MKIRVLSALVLLLPSSLPAGDTLLLDRTPECIRDLPVFSGEPRMNYWNTVRDRTLSEYGDELTPQFVERLKAITARGPEAHWIDLGAGEARAIDAYARGKDPNDWFGKDKKRARVTGIDLHIDNPWREEPQAHARYLERTKFDVADLDLAAIGKADLITDIFGPLTYTHHLDIALHNALSLLTEKGALFIRQHDNSTAIIDAKGDKLTASEWLASIPGIKVTKLGKGKRTGDTLMIERVPGVAFRVPKLELKIYDNGAPPGRVFVEVAEGDKK